MENIVAEDARLNFIESLVPFAQAYPKRAPDVPMFHEQVGTLGWVGGRKIRRNPKDISSRAWKALVRDEQRFLRTLRRQAEQRRDQLYAAITGYDSVIAQRAAGFADDRFISKNSQTTVAAAWSSFARSGGFPVAATYAAVPGGSVLNTATAGAPPLTIPSGSNTKFLLNVGVNHLTGNNVVLLVDILVAAGNISANVITTTTVSTAALTRYTGSAAAGNMMTYEVTTALGATASNLTTTYTDPVNGAGRTTAAIAMTTSAIAFRLQPTANAPLIALQSGDSGVTSVDTAAFSAAMGAGVVAALIYRPLVFLPTITTTTFVERSTPAQLSGITQLIKGTDSQLGFLTPFVLASGTSTGVQTYYLQTVASS